MAEGNGQCPEMSRQESLGLGQTALQGLAKGQAEGQGWVGLLRRGEKNQSLYEATKEKIEVELWSPIRAA